MMATRKAFYLLFLFLAIMPLASRGAPGPSAQFTLVKNEVFITSFGAANQAKKNPASVNDVVKSAQVVTTGRKSMAELEFQDKTIARLGQFSVFSFKKDKREYDLLHGSGLFNVTPSTEVLSIKTAAVTAAVTGTTLLVQSFNGYDAVFVYEGTVTIGGVALTAGQVYILQDGVAKIYSFDPVQTAANSELFTDVPDGSPFDIQFQQMTGQIPPPPTEDHSNEMFDAAIVDPRVKREADDLLNNSSGPAPAAPDPPAPPADPPPSDPPPALPPEPPPDPPPSPPPLPVA